MSESKHTPGPWKVYPVGASVPHYDVCPRVVADHPSGRSVSDPIPEADARLIAAAPDLYRVATLDQEAADLVDELATCRNGTRRVEIENRLDVIWDEKAVLRRAAIAKAEGKP